VITAGGKYAQAVLLPRDEFGHSLYHLHAHQHAAGEGAGHAGIRRKVIHGENDEANPKPGGARLPTA
jgi:hypothetical protein